MVTINDDSSPFVLTDLVGPLGQLLLEQERQLLEEELARFFGGYLVHYGPAADMPPDAQQIQRSVRLGAPFKGVEIVCEEQSWPLTEHAADVVVSMGGYNTICELLTLRKRAVVVPRVRPVQEQCIRAERMEEMGLMRTVHPDRLTPQRLLEATTLELSELRGNGENPNTIRLDGLEQVADAIFGLMRTERLEAAPRLQQTNSSLSRRIPTWTNYAQTVAQSVSW